MRNRGTAALFILSLASVTVISAPVAEARPTCQGTATTSICETNGSVSLRTRPGTKAPPAARPVFPWLGLPGAR